MNHWDREKYVKAWDFATLYHQGQTYGGPKPDMHIDYLNHIGAVAMEVIWALHYTTQTYDADLAIQCALLHDVIEDTSVTYELVKTQFGEVVAVGVQALTKNIELESKQAQMLDSLTRIGRQPKEIGMVKMADRICNLSAPPYYWKKEKIQTYWQESQIIYQALYTDNELLAARLQEKIEFYPHFL
ncbi:bifunctional (p)ppGpp synthetase/guanosine-3',5'-bis(diphosphate) 3'-pyrophosphohydrolase [Rhodocytophaga rosea]|uniref:Bifunctional (P)ppGpp synthetase/guanosine-3',5'-bis(Diphosphate) 3'-pyrophosphohydrolase n=1 Tax=Rhodocytophaga rosea TaxID=2704465 RepID=A0A6C0GGZ3_9BACT|nr:HD domain-containing protein [Rhodocytophaga rosea]QHT66992.1 bifunctional (p)ppGpp synthetase/guanosine-3',5'-bis(diphosphate) 3'-pyrophosphohydrolase [Rhodocytophaga rosea]